MTNPIPHGQVPESLRLAEEISNLVCSSEAAAKTIAVAADELCRLHVENASLRAQRPASPPAEQQATKETSDGFHVWRDISTAPKDGSRFVATGHNYGLYGEVRHTCVAQWFLGCWMEASDWNETSELKYLTHWMPLPSPPDDVAAPAEQQAAHKAAPGEQDDHQILAITTAYEQGVGKGHQAYNSGKEIANPYSPAYRCDLAWQYGYKEGKEQAQREAKAAPQQEAQEPTEIPEEIERMAADRYKVVPSHESMFHRWAVVAGTGTQQLYLGREVECQNMARKFAGAFLDGAFVTMQSTSPNPAPAPLSESIDQLERELATIGVVGAIDGYDVVRRESVLEIARRAAIAAQGGKA